MIRPSRRQRASRPTSEQAFTLHRRIAARSGWSVRLLRGSGAALLGSLVAAATAVPPWQLGLALVGAFVIGAALPVRGRQRQALRFIRERSGLSYETSLELAGREDVYGFADAVRTRAVDSVRDVRPPEMPAWWLPALAAALALLLFPLAGRQARTPGGVSNPSATTPAEAGTQPTAPKPETAPAPPPTAPQRGPAGTSGNPSKADGSATGSTEAGGGAANDQQVLSRYLQTLQQTPPAGAAPSGQGAGTSEGAGGGTTEPTQAAPRTGATRSGSESGSGTGAPSDGRNGAGAGGSAGQQPSAGGEAQGQSGSGGDQQAGRGAPPSGAASQPPGGASGSGSQQAQQPQAPPPGSAGALGNGASPPSPEGANGTTPQQGGGSQSGPLNGQPEQGPADGGAQPGARNAEGSGAGGNQPGTPGPVTPPLQGGGQAPQFLPGQLRPGAQSASGSLRLPGSKDVTLPPGTSIESYRRAAEQALTEGDVPLEYQDVLRRYFR
ncbi:MAG: hypothetical protein P8Y02_01965 [Deinococcales bacterium]